MPKTLSISFPHMGDYHLPIGRLLQDLFPEAGIVPAPPITQKTVALGARHSPDFVCSPFKYNMGNYIEALDNGANVLLQTGMGCRYGYYGELQEQILRDMGYSFTFLCLSRDRARLGAIYKTCKKLNPHLTRPVFFRALLRALARIHIMDRLDKVFREKIGFEIQKGSFDKAKQSLLSALTAHDTIPALSRVYIQYKKIYSALPADMPQNPLRVGLVGELYTLMEPFSNHNLERQLAKAGVVVTRKMSVSFLLFGKHDGLSLRRAGQYLRHTVGANGVDSVAQGRQYIKKGYDGIVHIKSFGCTPELNAQPALMNISRDENIPVLHLSFDTQTSQTGLETRLEAFTDMIKMKRERYYGTNSQPGHRRGLHFHQGRIG